MAPTDPRMSGEESNDEFDEPLFLPQSEESSTAGDDEKEDDEQEPPSDYTKGGYHPVDLGDVFDSRYYILRKLGWGHFATVWLSFDTRKKIFAAIKIPKSRHDFIEASRDELDILKVINEGDQRHIGAQNVVQILNEFQFFGVEQSLHLCMVFEVLGDNLLTLLRKYNNLNLNLVRVISRQLLQGLAYLHEGCNIIHTDIKPENVVISLTAAQLNNLALEAYNSRNWTHIPKSMVSTCPDKYRKDYFLAFPQNIRKRIRRNRKKQRERLVQYLSGIRGSPTLDEIEKNGNNVVNGSSNGNSVSYNGEESDDHIHRFYDELQEGRLEALKNVKVKIVDFGNACYVNHHYTDEIQTREYRSPEAILGSEYDASADVWSAACLIFELISGDYLFYPEANDYDEYDIDDDHIAKMIEILGPMPPNLFREGRRYYDIFDQRGRLLRIRSLQPTSMVELLMDIADLPGIEAKAMSDFLTPMLAYSVCDRASASSCLKSKWLQLSEMRGTKPKRRVPSAANF